MDGNGVDSDDFVKQAWVTAERESSTNNYCCVHSINNGVIAEIVNIVSCVNLRITTGTHFEVSGKGIVCGESRYPDSKVITKGDIFFFVLTK